MSTVLLLHAGVADSRMWAPQVEALEAAGQRVLAPDLRGFGERRLEPARFSHLRDAEVLLDGPAAVVGNSLGGRVALELAVGRPDLVASPATSRPPPRRASACGWTAGAVRLTTSTPPSVPG